MTPAQLATLDAAAIALELNVGAQLADEVRAIAAAARTELPPLRWKATTVCFTRFITDARYQKLRPSLQRWYEPVCPDCAPSFARTPSRTEPPLLDAVDGLTEVIFGTRYVSMFVARRIAKAIAATHRAAPPAKTQTVDEGRPDILERLTYHQHERDDMTLDDALDYLAAGWMRVHGRTERQLILQICSLLASSPVPAELAATLEPDAETVMEQAQVYASAWSLVGGQFDDGSMLGTANEEKAALRALVERLAAAHPAPTEQSGA